MEFSNEKKWKKVNLKNEKKEENLAILDFFYARIETFHRNFSFIDKEQTI